METITAIDVGTVMTDTKTPKNPDSDQHENIISVANENKHEEKEEIKNSTRNDEDVASETENKGDINIITSEDVNSSENQSSATGMRQTVSDEDRTLFVGDLPTEVTASDLSSLFQTYGNQSHSIITVSIFFYRLYLY